MLEQRDLRLQVQGASPPRPELRDVMSALGAGNLNERDQPISASRRGWGGGLRLRAVEGWPKSLGQRRAAFSFTPSAYHFMGQPTDDHTNTSTRRVDNEIAHSCVTITD